MSARIRFFAQGGLLGALDDDGDAHHTVYDMDQRQWITVSTFILWGSPLLDPDHGDGFDEEWEARRAQAEELLKEHIDTVAVDIKGVVVETSGKLRFVNKPCFDNNGSTFYPLLESYQLPHGTFKTILRSDITELGRLAIHVDLVSYDGMEKGAFKYHHSPRGFTSAWAEYQILARLPKHPNILPVDRLVLDEQTGKRVLGFTTPFIEGGDLHHNKNRLFKLKHLRQLMEVVDFLNYKLGITHNDMAPRNLLIDSSTDNLILFDFNVSERTGYLNGREGSRIMRSMKERNDVKGVVMTVHELLTRDPRYEGVQLHNLDETDLLAGPEKWVKHPEVQLEPGVDAVDYYNELMRWVKAHVERPIPVYTEASDPLDWPRREYNYEEEPFTYGRDEAEKRGWPYIDWIRPRRAYLDRSRRLLATGRYADDPWSTSGAGWESEDPVTEARLKDDKASQEQQVPAPVPVPVAITSTANPDPKPSDATAEPETGSSTTDNITTDNNTPDNTTTNSIATDNNTPDNTTPDNITPDTTTTTTTNTTPTGPPPSTPPQPHPDTSRTMILPTTGTKTDAKTDAKRMVGDEIEHKVENKVKNRVEPREEGMPPLKAARTTAARKRAASAALRDDGRRPAARRSPRVRARSLSRGVGRGGGVGK